MCIQRRVTEAGMGSPPWPHTPGAGTGVHLGWQHSPAPNREQSCRGINWEHKANHPASPVGGPFPSQVRIPWRQPSRWLRETWHTWNSRGNQTPPLILRGERCVSRPTVSLCYSATKKRKELAVWISPLPWASSCRNIPFPLGKSQCSDSCLECHRDVCQCHSLNRWGRCVK